MTDGRHWQARWINGEHGASMGTPYLGGVNAAPCLRRAFTLADAPARATVWLAAPGWHELYVNGQKADDRVLAPVITQFDRHVAYIKYEIAPLLHAGLNAVAVILGNGWYNCHTPEVWQFTHAPWRDFPKLLCEIEADGRVVAASDASWKTARSPITFDGLRNGEHYDARREIPGFADPDLDDSAWENAGLCLPPGGEMLYQDLEPCRVMRRYPVAASRELPDGSRLYDFGVNLTGWCETTFRGEADQEVIFYHGEKTDADGGLDCSNIGHFIKSGGFQEDHYILKGGAAETWHPHFTYHGFRYVRVCADFRKVAIEKIEACLIHNSFAEAGSFTSSDAMLDRLQELTLQSYRCNFTGIPTDCPHREKNGWTGDANLAMETGLWNYDGRKAYLHYLQILADCQRPNGQLPGIAPTGGWGYNWGSGPAWDSALFEIPEKLYLYYGDATAIRRHYDALKRYMDYCESMAVDGLLAFGLGDWCHWDGGRMTPVEVTSSGYYYANARRLARFAALLNRPDDERYYEHLAAAIRARFNAKFYHPEDHTYADRAWTALGAALFFGLCGEENAPAVADALTRMVRANAHKADFGILGAKYVPRALSDYGHADDAFQLLTQPEFPGWGYWVKCGATTLREQWNNADSQNHIMFGDISAWMYQYPGGLSPLWETPGFRHFRIRPCFIPALREVRAEHRAPGGLIRSAWRRTDAGIECEFVIPDGATADIVLPGQTIPAASGTVRATVRAGL